MLKAKSAVEIEMMGSINSVPISIFCTFALSRVGKAILVFITNRKVCCAVLLLKKGVNAAVVNARFVTPLDGSMLEEICRTTKKMVTIEEGVLEGGFGSAVLEFLEREGIQGIKVRRIGLPDRFIEHGKRKELFQKYNLTPEAICDVIMREVV